MRFYSLAILAAFPPTFIWTDIFYTALLRLVPSCRRLMTIYTMVV